MGKVALKKYPIRYYLLDFPLEPPMTLITVPTAPITVAAPSATLTQSMSSFLLFAIILNYICLWPRFGDLQLKISHNTKESVEPHTITRSTLRGS